MVALGALGCGSDNKAADNKAGSKVTGSVTGSGSSALLPLAKDAASKFKAINPDVSITLNGGGGVPGLKPFADGIGKIGDSDVQADITLHPDCPAVML